MDDLNTHSIASLYTAFAPADERRLAEKLEIHYTPKHTSWLDMAVIEIGIMSWQCLSDYIITKDSYSIIESVKLNNLNVLGYLTHLFTEILKLC